MNNEIFRISNNIPLAKNVFRMELCGNSSEISRPGQFVNIALDGFFLRRPISVCDLEKDKLTIIYKVVGKGTAAMSTMAPGQTLEVLTGLGNGYDLSASGKAPLLIGGGVGAPPMYLLAKELLKAGAKPRAILGFNTRDEVFMEQELKVLGIPVTVTTVDGSYGIKGFVTDALPRAGDYDYSFACGPEPMLRAVYDKANVDGQYSFEERMGCGFGACMGCTCKTKYGNKRICVDGPVLVKEEIKW